jgi:predicted RNA-binding Zn-ribbon protein involved in translation (DUF1610 family)
MKYCLDCGFAGEPKWHTPGTLGMEICLWLLFVAPGVIYTLWRHFASRQACPKCGSKHIVPTDSALAQAVIRRLSPTEARSQWFCMACGKPIFSEGSLCDRCAAQSSGASGGTVPLQN